MNKETLYELAQSCATPMYVFDIAGLKQRVRFLRDHLPDNVGLCYAVKANPFLVREIADHVDRFEICSPGEGAICENLRLPREKMVISGVYKAPDDLRHLVWDCPGIGHYTVESMAQFRLLSELGREACQRLPVLLRLTSGNQFGLSGAEIREIVGMQPETLDIRGLQYFSGTQKHSLRRVQREISALDRLIVQLKEDQGFEVRELEYGPGFPVSYFRDEGFEEESFLECFSDILKAMTSTPQITLELGRSLAAGCGTYLTRVVDTKRNLGQNYAILDGGIHHLVYYGQNMAMRTPQLQILPPRPEAGECWNLFGSLCTVNDILVKQLPADGLSVGDLIAFENTGAYCMTEGISLFLSRDLPGIFLLTENGTLVPVRKPQPTFPFNTPVYNEKGTE